jgi:hypothetical protein
MNCNVFDNNPGGIGFYGTALNTYAQGNEFNSHTVGLRVGDGGSVTSINPHRALGLQNQSTANFWNGTSSLFNAQNTNGGFVSSTQQFYYDPGLPAQDPATLGPLTPANGWFFQQPNVTSFLCTAPAAALVHLNNFSAFDLQLASGSFNPNTLFSESVFFRLNRYLLDKLEDTVVTGQTYQSLFAQYYDSIVNTSVKGYQKVDSLIAAAQLGDTALQSKIDSINLSLVPHWQMVDSLMNLLESGAGDSLTINTALYHTFVLIDSLMQLRQVYTTQCEAAKLQEWALVQTTNASQPDTLTIEWVTQQSNALLAKYAQSDKIFANASDSLLLEQIAAMCPVEGGNGVYLARSMRNSFRYTIPNDHQNCKQRGLAYREDKQPKESPQPTIRVFPNPVSDYMVIDILGIEKPEGLVELMDIAGRKVWNGKITQSFSVFSLAHLPAGSYLAKTDVPGLEGQRTFQVQLIRP